MPTFKFGGNSVMMWACFAGGEVGDLVKVDGTINRHGYHNILQRHALPSGQRLVGDGFIFQQDNAPIHTARLNKRYLGKLEKPGDCVVTAW